MVGPIEVEFERVHVHNVPGLIFYIWELYTLILFQAMSLVFVGTGNPLDRYGLDSKASCNNFHILCSYNAWVRQNEQMVRTVEQYMTLAASLIPGYIGSYLWLDMVFCSR